MYWSMLVPVRNNNRMPIGGSGIPRLGERVPIIWPNATPTLYVNKETGPGRELSSVSTRRIVRDIFLTN